jgi:hypothetical protein
MLDIFERIEDWPQRSRAQRSVEVLGKTLKIDISRVHHCKQLFAGVGCDVARRHGDSLQAGFAAGGCDIDRILKEDHRVVVSEGNRSRSHLLRGSRDCGGRGLSLKPVELGRFGNVPVLAELTREVATGGPKREHRSAWQKVVEWLLLDWVDAETRGSPVGCQNDRIIVAGAHKAQAALAFPQLAKTRAKVTLDAAVPKLMPIAASGPNLGPG